MFFFLIALLKSTLNEKKLFQNLFLKTKESVLFEEYSDKVLELLCTQIQNH